MAVYNPPDQILFSPVTNYYKGKAIRQQLETGEADLDIKKKQAEALGLEIESAPAKAAAAQRKEDRDKEKVDIAREKEDRIAAAAAEKEIAQRLYADTDTFKSLSSSDSQEAASTWLTKKWEPIYDGMPDGPEKQRFGQILQDGITPEEVEEARNTFGSILGREDDAGGEELTRLQDRLADPDLRPEDRAGIEARIAKLTTVTGRLETDPSFGVTKSGFNKNIADFKTAGKGAVGAVRTGTELVVISFQDPAALGKPGGIAKFGNEMLVTATALLGALKKQPGYKEAAKSEYAKQVKGGAEGFNFDSFDAGFMKDTAIESTAFRAGVYGIAFAAAVAEQGTRPTDKDIQQFIDQIGGNTSDPAAFRRTIAQFMRRQDHRLHDIADIDEIPDAHQAAVFRSWDAAYGDFKDALNSGGEPPAESGFKVLRRRPAE